MQQNHKTELYELMMEKLEKFNPQNWKDIDDILIQVKESSESAPESVTNSFPKEIKNGIAFITDDYGLDGVSIYKIIRNLLMQGE